MIPISDDNPTRLTPIITWAIIALCATDYLWERSAGRHMDEVVAVLGFTPASLFGYRVVMPGYVSPPAIETIFSSMFLHGSILHIAGNMLYLWIFGNNVEDAMGHFRFTVFYLVCGIAAALTLAYVDPSSRLPMVGASGAISGVLAAYVLLFPRARVLTFLFVFFLWLPAWLVLGYWFVVQFLSGAATAIEAAHHASQGGGIALWAHVGGFISGIALIKLFPSRPRRFRYYGT